MFALRNRWIIHFLGFQHSVLETVHGRIGLPMGSGLRGKVSEFSRVGHMYSRPPEQIRMRGKAGAVGDHDAPVARLYAVFLDFIHYKPDRG